MSSIVNIVQRSRILYNLYYYVGLFLVNILKLSLKADPKLIVFNSFGGKKYDDSPKAIYLGMLEDERFIDYKFVWAFKNPDSFSIPRGEKVRVDSLNYYKAVLKARVWITNTTMTRALRFSGINTFSLNTWHGTAIKKIGEDARKEGVFVSKGGGAESIFLAQGEYDRDVFSKAFKLSKEKIKILGLPRNDELSIPQSLNMINDLKEKLSIPLEKKVILYAPTFREYVREGSSCELNSPIDFEKWQNALADKYVLLMRAHHAIIKTNSISENSFIKNVSSYPHLNDLMLVSDILISDYSSIFFDYAILGKPMFCYAYDYARYTQERGVYFDIRQELDNEHLDTDDDLLSALINIDVEKRIEITKKFKDKYIQKYGTATRDSIELIYNAIN